MSRTVIRKIAWGILFFSTRAFASDATYQKLDVFAQVLQYVENSYVDEVKSDRLLYGAIRGMLKTLDPHTSFLTPEEFKSIQEDTSGHFGGIGLELEQRSGVLTVVSPIDDTPAARAGILPNDQITAIDGDSARKMDVSEATRRLKGVPGTKVVLSIDRDDFEKPRDFVLVREQIRLNPVERSMPLPGYGQVRIRTFTERTERYMMEALTELKRQAGGELKGIVLDLRNNPGGLLEQAVRVADRFVVEGLIVETRGRNRRVERDMAHKAGTEAEYPIVCLVNGGSASASEIVAGALQDHRRALIMGLRTFGKGSVQTIIGLKDGSGLKLTIARYFTPSGRSIQERGIEPDVVVPVNPPEGEPEIQVLREADLEGHLRSDSSQAGDRKKIEAIDDYQLRTALHYLLAWERFGPNRGARSAAGR